MQVKCPHCNKEIDSKEITAQLGRIGGLTLKKQKGKDYFKKIGQKGLEKRWSK